MVSATKPFQFPAPLAVTDEELDVLIERARPSIPDWFEDHYRLPPETSEVTGLYSFEYTPFFREPLERLSRPPVKVGIESCTQVGKSTIMVGVFGYIADEDPGPTLFAMPRKDDAERRVNTRVIPMFRANPELLRHVPGGDVRNFNIGKETVLDRMIAFLAWSTSAATMADNPICNVLVDEPGKFEVISKTKEDPFDLLEKRQRTYNTRRRFFYVTSPQDDGDLSDRQFRAGSDERWFVPCQKCGKWHKIGASDKTIFIEKDANGVFFEPNAYLNKSTACYYFCPHCKQEWNEIDRMQSIAAGRWVPKTQTMDPGGKVRGDLPAGNHYTYRANSMMIHPRFWSVREEVREFVGAVSEQKAGNLEKLRDYTRNQQARPWKTVAKTMADETLQQRIDPGLHRRCVPVGSRVLVASADYHEDEEGNVRIDFEVRAFASALKNAVILAGSVSDWRELEAELMGAFPWADADCDDEELAVVTVFADSGFKSDEVYTWCRKYPGWAWPIKGVEKQRTPLVVSDLEAATERAHRKGRRKKVRASAYRGMQLVLVDQDYFSGMITSWVEPDSEESGATTFYAEIAQDTRGGYFTEFAGMQRVRKKRGAHAVWTWMPKTPSTAVHFHDVARYAAAAGWFNKVHLIGARGDDDPVPEAIARKIARRKQISRRVGKMGRFSVR